MSDNLVKVNALDLESLGRMAVLNNAWEAIKRRFSPYYDDFEQKWVIASRNRKAVSRITVYDDEACQQQSKIDLTKDAWVRGVTDYISRCRRNIKTYDNEPNPNVNRPFLPYDQFELAYFVFSNLLAEEIIPANDGVGYTVFRMDTNRWKWVNEIYISKDLISADAEGLPHTHEDHRPRPEVTPIVFTNAVPVTAATTDTTGWLRWTAGGTTPLR